MSSMLPSVALRTTSGATFPRPHWNCFKVKEALRPERLGRWSTKGLAPAGRAGSQAQPRHYDVRRFEKGRSLPRAISPLRLSRR